MNLITCTPCYNKIPLVVIPKYLLKLWDNHRLDLALCQNCYNQLPDFIQAYCIDMSGSWGYIEKEK